MKIIFKNVDDLIPYVNNSRTHSDKQILQIASSIKEFGFTNPILIDEDFGIIAGHGRLFGAKKLDMKEIPCIILKNLSAAQKKAYVIADNKLALNADWNDELLRLELEDLKDLDFDLFLLGFDNQEIDELIFEENDDLTDEDDLLMNEEFGIHITLNSENEQKELFEEMKKRGLPCKIMN